MLLQKLILENFGAYKTHSEIDLSCNSNKPIILIGGLNGSGKTTILESIMICLFGKKYLGNVTNIQYHDFLKSKMYRHKRSMQKKTVISISFLFHTDKIVKYTVERIWYISNDEGLTEKMNVIKDDKLIDIDSAHWQTFVEDLIPFEIAKLFFLDSEKIIEMMNSQKTRNIEIQKSIDSLLGFDIIERLQTDLRLYVQRNSKKELKESSEQYKNLTKEKKTLQKFLDSLQYNLKLKQQSHQQILSEIASLESSINKKGGIYAKRREKLTLDRVKVQELLKIKERTLRYHLSTLGPFCLFPSLLMKISSQITADLNNIQNNVITDFLDNYLHDSLKNISQDFFTSELKTSKQITNSFTSKLKIKLLSNLQTSNLAPLFDLSTKDYIQFDKLIESDIPNLTKTFRQLSKEHIKLSVELNKIESELSKVPSDDAIGPLFSNLKLKYEESGVIAAELGHIEEKISSRLFAYKIIKNKLVDTLKSQQQVKIYNTKLSLAIKLQEVLDTYTTHLLEAKILKFETHLLETISYLLHKTDLIKRVDVDRKTFKISLYDSENKLLSDDLLSMGERQMICTAILWALAMISGRSLPFIIDTPMARLDSLHRARLVKFFFPIASYQVIILSTNTEITQNERKTLNPKISKSYILIHNAECGTKVSNGYFSEEQQHVIT